MNANAITTASTAALAKVAEDLKSATGKIHRKADLTMRLSLRLELVESQQIGRALRRSAGEED